MPRKRFAVGQVIDPLREAAAISTIAPTASCPTKDRTGVSAMVCLILPRRADAVNRCQRAFTLTATSLRRMKDGVHGGS